MSQEDDHLVIPAERLGWGTGFEVEILDTNVDLYHDIARAMFDLVRSRNAEGRPGGLPRSARSGSLHRGARAMRRR